jgi:hypothetical protein
MQNAPDNLPIPDEIRESMNLAFHTDLQRQIFVRGYEGIIAGGGPIPTVEQLLRLMKAIIAYTDNPDIPPTVTDAEINELVRQSQIHRNQSN